MKHTEIIFNPLLQLKIKKKKKVHYYHKCNGDYTSILRIQGIWEIVVFLRLPNDKQCNPIIHRNTSIKTIKLVYSNGVFFPFCLFYS